MTKPKDILDLPILGLGDGSAIRAREFCQGGTLITGDSGCGKSSTSAKEIICAFMRNQFGLVLHTIKPGDTATYLGYAHDTGRMADVLVFNEESGLTFDCIAYEWSRSTGRGGGDVEGIIDYFDTLTSIGKPQATGEGRFWDLAAPQAMRHAIHLIRLADETLSIANVYKAISSFPNYLGEEESEAWLKNSYTAELIRKIEARKEQLTEEDWENAETSIAFVFVRWATFDERPRSSVIMTVAGLADKFTLNPFKKLFASGKFSFTPEQVTHSKLILILDFPVLEYGKETARLIQTMLKLTYQRAWLRHAYKPGCCNGACLVQDEFQLLISRFESHFAQTVRSSAIASLYITQTILNLAEELGESQPGSKTKAFLNNLGIKIAHRSTCPDTCQYFADIVGKSYRYLEGYSANAGGTHGVSGSRQLVHDLDPQKLTRLERPDGTSPLSAAYVYRGGDIYDSTRTESNPAGSNFLKVFFSRD